MYRTHNCNELRINHVNETVTLSGWIKKIRITSIVKFIDIRDMYGVTQLIIEKTNNQLFNIKLHKEYVIKIKGKVCIRKSKNIKLNTGDIEILVHDLYIINTSKIPPFILENKTDGTDEIRMKYRYLDFRRDIVKHKLINRSIICDTIRKFLKKKKFLEIDTPILIKSTPEGARDFIVPSRHKLGSFYALPQSPQLFKQMLMIGGIDKYFQIAKCFRDEDFRSNRQPEFTQIDAEMSFISSKNIMYIFEKCINHIFKKTKNIIITKPWKILTYKKALKYYGTDKPDIRFNMQIINLKNRINNIKYKISHPENDFLAIKVPLNKYITSVNEIIDIINNNNKINNININNIICIKNSHDIKINSNKIIKSKEEILHLINITDTKKEEILIILLGCLHIIRNQIGKLRVELGMKINIIDKNKLSPLWVIEFPLMQWDKKNKKYQSVHHPFTSPKLKNKDIDYQNLQHIISDSYDLVINGQEIGGGSIRIHEKKLQTQIFKFLGFNKNEYMSKFGFFINAFDFGVPPHGGIALGLDRLMQVLYSNEMESSNIKEFIPFPKDKYGQDIMLQCPDRIEKNILKELNIKISKKN